jgi:hypothetical protein
MEVQRVEQADDQIEADDHERHDPHPGTHHTAPGPAQMLVAGGMQAETDGDRDQQEDQRIGCEQHRTHDRRTLGSTMV